MRKNVLKSLLSGLALFALFSCEDQALEELAPGTTIPELTVSEARTCFEERMYKLATRSTFTPDKKGLNVDFTPHWDKAVALSTSSSAFVTIPISPMKQVLAFYREISENGQHVCTKVYQKLIVVRDIRGNTAPYVMSFLPDIRYYAKNKGEIDVKHWNKGGNFGDFTGLVAYNIPNADFPIRIDTYVDGRKVDGASVFDFIKGEKGQLIKLHSYFKDIKFQQVPFRLITRSTNSEESEGSQGGNSQGGDNWNTDYNPGSYHYIGNIGGHDYWSHTDSNGKENVFYDSNGDGKPDSVWLDDIVVTPDNNNENNGNDGNNENNNDNLPSQPDPGNNENPSGGGGSSSGSGNQPIVAPKAKKIFRNSHMTETNWKRIENMLEKIIANPMGKNLYNELVQILNGKTLTIQFDPSLNYSYFTADGETAGIVLHLGESNILFHEMFHAYQAYQETLPSMLNSSLNREIEAWYAQYLYVKGLKEYKPGSKWQRIYKKYQTGRTIAGLEWLITPQGDLKPGIKIEILEQYLINSGIGSLKKHDAYKNKTYDYDRILENFKNLRRLNKIN